MNNNIFRKTKIYYFMKIVESSLKKWYNLDMDKEKRMQAILLAGGLDRKSVV